MYKAAILLAVVVAVNAGGVYLDHHVGQAAEQLYRGPGGLSSVSTQARTVNSLYSTSSAYKNKVTNNAVAYAAPAIAAPAYAQAIAAPAYAAPAIAAPIARVAAPVAKVAHPAGLLGVAYSPVVPGVASYTFDGFGAHIVY